MPSIIGPGVSAEGRSWRRFPEAAQALLQSWPVRRDSGRVCFASQPEEEPQSCEIDDDAIFAERELNAVERLLIWVQVRREQAMGVVERKADACGKVFHRLDERVVTDGVEERLNRELVAVLTRIRSGIGRATPPGGREGGTGDRIQRNGKSRREARPESS